MSDEQLPQDEGASPEQAVHNIEEMLHNRITAALEENDPRDRMISAPGYAGDIPAAQFADLLLANTEPIPARLLCKGDVIRVAEYEADDTTVRAVIFWEVVSEPFRWIDGPSDVYFSVNLQRKPTPHFGLNRKAQDFLADTELEVILRQLDVFQDADQ